MKEQKVLSIDAIQHTLDSAGLSHRGGYYHYTVANKFRKALASRKWFFSHPSRLNDKIEEGVLKDTMYLASFAFGTEENVAMWGNYGWPRADAIRIRIAKKAITDFKKKYDAGKIAVYRVWQTETGTIFDPLSSRPKLSIHDVGYLSRRERNIAHNGILLKPDYDSTVLKRDQKEPLSSYLKKRGWEYEQEVRLVLNFTTKSVPKEKDGTISKIVAIDFGEVLDSIKDAFASITLGPWATSEVRDHLKGIPSNCIVPSDYTGMIDFPGGEVRAISGNPVSITNSTVYINGNLS